MIHLLAVADSGDSAESNYNLVLLCIVGLASVCAFVGLVIFLAKRMGHRNADTIITLVMFWGMIAAGSVVNTVMTQFKWAHEHLLSLLSGYGDPHEVGPSLPWGLWIGLEGIYFLLLGWTVWRKVFG